MYVPLPGQQPASIQHVAVRSIIIARLLTILSTIPAQGSCIVEKVLPRTYADKAALATGSRFATPALVITPRPTAVPPVLLSTSVSFICVIPTVQERCVTDYLSQCAAHDCYRIMRTRRRDQHKQSSTHQEPCFLVSLNIAPTGPTSFKDHTQPSPAFAILRC